MKRVGRQVADGVTWTVHYLAPSESFLRGLLSRVGHAKSIRSSKEKKRERERDALPRGDLALEAVIASD
jgi:hypothetical protein